MIPLARIALSGPLPADDFQLSFNSRDAILDAAAVGFQLSFTFTTAHPNSALLSRQVAPKACQSRQQVLQLGQFDLEFAFFGPGALGENIEDQRSPIEDFAIKNPLQIAALGGRKLIVENDRIHICPATMLGKFIRFALANECGRAGCGKSLQTIADNLSSGGRGQFGKFLQ